MKHPLDPADSRHAPIVPIERGSSTRCFHKNSGAATDSSANRRTAASASGSPSRGPSSRTRPSSCLTRSPRPSTARTSRRSPRSSGNCPGDARCWWSHTGCPPSGRPTRSCSWSRRLVVRGSRRPGRCRNSPDRTAPSAASSRPTPRPPAGSCRTYGPVGSNTRLVCLPKPATYRTVGLPLAWAGRRITIGGGEIGGPGAVC